MNKNIKCASAPIFPQSTKQRCKKGDLAIRTDREHSTLIVEVGEYHGTVGFGKGLALFDAWEVFHPIYAAHTGWHYFCEDKYLIPIRPGDLEETGIDELSLVKGESL